MKESTGIAVVGAGYWGPNLIRNTAASQKTDLKWIVDLDADVLARVAAPYPSAKASTDLDAMLADPEVTGVVLATPARTHAPIASRCLEAGKHVLVEKPLASTVEDGEALVKLADEKGLKLMCDHTFCYTGAVRHIAEVTKSGVLGDIHTFDSVRVNLGLIQSDIDVYWDLAPHDLSILDYVLPPEAKPVSVSAQGADPMGVGHPCVGHFSMQLANGGLAHVHVNWLSPTKVRTTMVGGSKKMLVWDDLRPSQKVSIFDSGADLRSPMDATTKRETLVSYRTGDMVAPNIPGTEALKLVIEEFADSIVEDRTPLTDGRAGLRVLKALAAVQKSLEQNGAHVELDWSR